MHVSEEQSQGEVRTGMQIAQATEESVTPYKLSLGGSPNCQAIAASQSPYSTQSLINRIRASVT